jgi:hypothetical protein
MQMKYTNSKKKIDDNHSRLMFMHIKVTTI